MEAVEKLGAEVGIQTACDALGLNRASFYRRKTASPEMLSSSSHSPLKLADEERNLILDVLHCERFVDQSPATIYAILLDEGVYLCSVRTMYRILAQENEVRERRNQLRHPKYEKPELLATAPNQVWSWDITKLKGPQKWSYFYLYVILDIFSRYAVGWMVARRESAELAKHLISESCQKQNIQPGQLIIHSDRGPSMTSKPVAFLLADLGVTKTHNRPYVSNDNPYSEAQFKTLKYRPDFPERFGSLEDSRGFSMKFFQWYNVEHRHSSIAYLTPESVHYGKAEEILQKRAQTLRDAFEANPERFKGRCPQPEALPKAAWINKPDSK